MEEQNKVKFSLYLDNLKEHKLEDKITNPKIIYVKKYSMKIISTPYYKPISSFINFKNVK